MKKSAPFCLMIAVTLAAGCAAQKDDFVPAPPASVISSAIVTPDNSIVGKVVKYNSTGRFVVLNFPRGRMPDKDQILFLYRGGLKVATVTITGPQSDDNIVADVTSGDAMAGEEVRDQ
jgi:hypothetical protein